MTLELRTCSALTPVPREERAAIAAGAPGTDDRDAHRAWVAALPCLREVEVTAAAGAPAPFEPGRVIAWNAERGRDVDALAALLARERPELVLLSEMDVGMARSGNRHTARDLAQRLGFGCVYAVEFVELGLGSPGERAAHAGEENTAGFHGGAILSARPLERPAVVRLEEDGAWFDRERGERRVGGRIAVLATWRLAGRRVTVASVHLESHSDPAARGAQIETLLDAIETYRPGAPALVGGDLNTFSLRLADLRDRTLLERALAEDPRRLLHPVPHEPLFERARARRYAWEPCNAPRVATHRVAAPDAATLPRSSRGGVKLDWFLSRGLECADPTVIEAVEPATGAALSDHEAIAVRVVRAAGDRDRASA